MTGEIDTAPGAAAEALELQARALTITSPDDYARVGEFLLGVKELRAQIAATFDSHIKRAYDAHRALCEEKRNAEASAIRAERLAKDLLLKWDEEQERIAEQERARLQQIANEEATNETLSRALEAVAAGEFGRAEQILEEPVPAATAAVAPATPRVGGLSTRETWSAELVDLLALVRFVAANPMWLGLLKADTKALDAQARSLRSRLAIPGVRAICSKDIAARRGRG